MTAGDSALDTVVIVGASLAGLSTVDGLRRSGYAGSIILIDAATAVPGDRPPLSKQVLRGESTPADHPLMVAQRLDDLKVELRLGDPAVGLDVERRSVRLAGGAEVAGDSIVIATGASARRFTVPGAQRPDLADGPDGGSDDVVVLRDAADAEALAARLAVPDRRVVVVGCGFIGAEVAASAAMLGHQVDIVEVASTPLQRVLPPAIGEWVRGLLERRGVSVHTGVGVDAIERTDDGAVSGVQLADGRVLLADVVVAGIGAEPVVSWLEGSGLEIDNGVVCDATLQAAPGIMAVGDVASVLNQRLGRRIRVEQWENAVEQGGYLGARLLTESPEPYRGLPYFWSDLFDVKLQLAGDPSPDDEIVVVDGSLDDDRFVALVRRGDECVGVIGAGRPRAVIMTRMALAEPLSMSDALARFGG